MSFSDEDLKDEQYCRICGFDFGGPTWEMGCCPSHDICPCCDAEVGIEDYTIESIQEHREQWLQEGGKWRSDSSYVAEPQDWNREKQMKNILPEWQ